MSEETNTGWAEMDIEAYRKNSNVEKKEQPEQKQAFEVEEPEEVPITHANVEAEVEEEEEVTEEPLQQQEDTIEELDGIKTKGAE